MRPPNAHSKEPCMSTLVNIAETVLSESSTQQQLQAALRAFSEECSQVSGVVPDRSFSAWSEDHLLEQGVAINPQAAAHCVSDYQRSVVFIRAVATALTALQSRFPDTPLRILYAGCGPYATLLLPLLHRFRTGQLDIQLLDIHQRSLDSALLLIDHFGVSRHQVTSACADATEYRHPQTLHLVIAETMQKSLEQEPQFAVTANLAPQLCAGGVFLPQRVDVSLQLARASDAAGTSATPAPQLLARLLSLQANLPKLVPVTTRMPAKPLPGDALPMLFTRIEVYGKHVLEAYESELTLPRPCPELTPLRAGAQCRASYHTGSYPGFELEYIEDTRQ